VARRCGWITPARLGCRAPVTTPMVEVGPPRGRRILAGLLAEEAGG